MSPRAIATSASRSDSGTDQKHEQRREQIRRAAAGVTTAAGLTAGVWIPARIPRAIARRRVVVRRDHAAALAREVVVAIGRAALDRAGESRREIAVPQVLAIP